MALGTGAKIAIGGGVVGVVVAIGYGLSRASRPAPVKKAVQPRGDQTGADVAKGLSAASGIVSGLAGMWKSIQGSGSKSDNAGIDVTPTTSSGTSNDGGDYTFLTNEAGINDTTAEASDIGSGNTWSQVSS